MKKILLTGFEPFGGDKWNPSGTIARELHGRAIAGHVVQGAVLPCVFGKSATELKQLLRQHRPALVICLGLANGRTGITPERVAINVDDARIPDNAGRQPVDRPVVRGGPAAYWSTLPIKAIVERLHRERIVAAVSQTAGTFVCNHVFYALMHELARRRVKIRGGFIHIPCQPEQAKQGEPSLSLATVSRAVELAIAVAVKQRREVRTTGGAEK
ncbi:MAG: pyroglutamyl-peptidase I [Lacunisphaera sp.]